MLTPLSATLLALLLSTEASAPVTPAANPEQRQFKPVAVTFHKVAAADPAKRSSRQMEFNHRFAPLMLITRPDGSQVLTHGPQQEIERVAPAEKPQ